MTEIILISVICCFVVNSGAVDSIKRAIWRWLKGQRPYQHFSLKPLDCELCLTWWTGIIYLLIIGEMTIINITIVAVVAWMTPLTADVMRLLQELPAWVLGKLFDKMS